ncbi:MAG: hypothetical protein IT333_06200 [Thermomicrobiales bacterium]|nr:hypothetical protein [Thermomicrobiales bacterium]
MARLHTKINGEMYIRTWKGDPDVPGEGWHGTWQLHGGGIDLLEQHNIVHDGSLIPIEIFLDLAARRLIWSETGTYPVQRIDH